MRNLLREEGRQPFRPATAAAMFFLNATDPTTIKLARSTLIGWGYAAQRAAHGIARRLGLTQDQTQRPPATVGAAPLRAQVIHFINKPMPGGLPKRTSRALLDIEDDAIVPIIRDPARGAEESEAVFYFPGCGSERLFSQVGLATQAMLWHVGAQTVLPPGYLCCGYPQTAAGDEDRGPADHHREPRAVPSRRQHAQLSRHQDGDRLLRHVHGPAPEVRVRRDLPGLPPARHPRIPAREGPSRRRGRRASGTCITTPATRR